MGLNLEAALAITGGLLITLGAAWVYPPAGLIVAGLLLLGSIIDWKR